jgi:hypothetical protein
LQTFNEFNCRIGDNDIAEFNASDSTIHHNIYFDECQIRKLKNPNADDDAATKRYVDHSVSAAVDRASVMVGPLDMGQYSINSVREPSSGSDATTKGYVDRNTSGYVKLDGSTVMSTSLNMGRNTITNVKYPSDAHDAVDKRYVDNDYVHVGNFGPRLIGNGAGKPAAPGIF